MIEIKPGFQIDMSCPECQSDKVTFRRLLFPGMHILADCLCQSCGLEFYRTLPVGHDLLFPTTFAQQTGKAWMHPRAGVWLAQPLLDAFFKHPSLEASVERIVKRQCEEVVILNCLDNCYGHVLLKLFNAQQFLDTQPLERGLIVVIPRNVQWLVPDGVAEAWVVDLSLKELTRRIGSLETFVQKQLERFNRVWLHLTNTHPDSTTFSMERFARTQPFDLGRFYELPLRITFVCREDRFWLRYPIEQFIFKGLVKFNALRWGRWYFVWRQWSLISRTVRLINKKLQGVQCTVTGIGITGRLDAAIRDLRTERMTLETEQEWCRAYADSHVVVGIHGSHMLIPTALSAGFVEMLPRHKIDHLAEDVAPAYVNRYRTFLGRFLDEFASPRLVALHSCSIIRYFPYLQINTETDFLNVPTPEFFQKKYQQYLESLGKE